MLSIGSISFVTFTPCIFLFSFIAVLLLGYGPSIFPGCCVPCTVFSVSDLFFTGLPAPLCNLFICLIRFQNLPDSWLQFGCGHFQGSLPIYSPPIFSLRLARSLQAH